VLARLPVDTDAAAKVRALLDDAGS
jgi:hypothetical protein